MESKARGNQTGITMEDGVRNSARQAFELLMCQNYPQFILAFESSVERIHVFANGDIDRVMALLLSIAEGLCEEMGYDSLPEFLIKLAEAEAKHEN